MIPKESEGEHFEDALARVCRCVGGGNAADNADSDSDLEVVADSIGVNLRCPVSYLHIFNASAPFTFVCLKLRFFWCQSMLSCELHACVYVLNRKRLKNRSNGDIYI